MKSLVVALIVFSLSLLTPSTIHVPAVQHPPIPEPYRFQLDQWELEVDPSHGGRIVAARIEGENLLSESSVDPVNYGSTFWPSPQRLWGWPPLPEIDSDPYQIEVSDSTLQLTSPVSSQLPLQVTKTFTIEGSSLAVTYTITNGSSHSLSVAPWEVTRIHPRGTLFYPTGFRQFNPSPFEDLITQVRDGLTWFDYDPDIIQTNQKLFADGTEGWIAHWDGTYLLLKTFEDIPLAAAAPGEGEIEIFVNGAKTYIEMEQQGPYTSLLPTTSLSWKVRWYVTKIPTAGVDLGQTVRTILTTSGTSP